MAWSGGLDQISQQAVSIIVSAVPSKGGEDGEAIGQRSLPGAMRVCRHFCNPILEKLTLRV